MRYPSLSILTILLIIGCKSDKSSPTGVLPQSTWVPVDSGLTDFHVNALGSRNNTVFAGTYNKGVFRSSDFGAHWVQSNTGLKDPYVSSFVSDESYLFVGTASGVFRSSTDGTNWIPAYSGLTDTIVTALAEQSGMICAGTPVGGVFFSTDHGSTWQARNSGLEYIGITSLAFHGNNLYAATSYRAGIYVTSDYGTTWIPSRSSALDNSAYSFAVSGTDLFVGTLFSGVYLWSDLQKTWIPRDNGLPYDSTRHSYGYVSPVFATQSTIFGATPYELYYSTDRGSTWQPVNANLPRTHADAITVCGPYIFVGQSGSGIWRNQTF